MKKLLAALALCALLITCFFVVCACDGTNESVIAVSAKNSSVDIDDEKIADYDYTQLFSIVKDNENVTVEKSLLDLSAVSAFVDSFTVTCTYEKISATVKVNVVQTSFVTLSQESVSLKPTQVQNYNFKSLFTVQTYGVKIPIYDDIVTTDVKAEPGTYHYTVTCGMASATLTVVVEPSVFVVEMTQQEITLHQRYVEGYNFLALFSATQDGEPLSITNKMVTSDVTTEPGTYHYTVTCGDVSKTLVVHVTDAHEIAILPSYNQVSLTVGQLSSYDYTMLFSLYVDGIAVQVTNDMLDLSQLQNAQAGQSYGVKLQYSLEGSSGEAQTTVVVVADAELRVDVKNVVTYPNGDYIDLTTLFVISRGSEIIPVTNEMVSGSIDYSQVGVNNIVMTYQGQTYTATVEVRRGVIIDYAKSDVVSVKRGTDKNTYLFAEDFVVYINGLRFRNIAQFIDAAAVDFSTLGEYQVTLTIPYNDKAAGISGVTFTNYTSTITYKVVETSYNISVNEQVVNIAQGTQGHNVLQNITFRRDNYYSGQLVSDKSYLVNRTFCYAEVVSEPVDYSQVGRYLVKINAYPECLSPEDQLGTPIEITFYVQIYNDVTIIATDRTILGKVTLYSTDLFQITEGGQNVIVTNDMVSGKVDTFRAGTYYVTAEYKGVSATAKVVIINPQMIGEYSTRQTTMDVNEDPYYDDDYEDLGWGYGEYEYDYDDLSFSPAIRSAKRASNRLANLVISEDGTITVRGTVATFVSSPDENTIVLTVGSNLYTLYYNDGIIVLDPDNKIKLGFSEYRRPLIYFKDSQWDINAYLIINYSKSHVLQLAYSSYSYDVFNLTNKQTNTGKCYALKTRLVSKSSSDTIYEVTWGDAVFPADFQLKQGVTSSITFQGQTEVFTMQSATVGKIDNVEEERIWANHTFRGTVNGLTSQLVFNQYEAVEFRIDGTVKATATSYEYNSMKNGGIDHANNILFLYDHDGGDYGVYSYKFLLNPQNNTFELLPQDGLLGHYSNDNMYVFLDGYGTAVVNFNKDSHEVFQAYYTVVNQEVKLTFFNTTVTFTHGPYVTFRIADLKNVLTAKYSVNGELDGTVLTNQVITDGAIVNFYNNKVSVGANCLQEIARNVQIITKDGELSYDQKIRGKIGGKNILDTSNVSVNQVGFYQLKVNVAVDGAVVTSYYAVQLVAPLTESPMAAYLGAGIINPTFSINLESTGIARLNIGGTIWEGYAIFNGTDEFIARVFSPDGREVTLNGSSLTTGITAVRASGAITFADYFTTGVTTIAGNDDNVLRKITVGETVSYIYAVAETSIGEVVTVVADSDDASILTVTRKNGTTFVAKVEWGNKANKGLTMADALRGTYTKEDSPNLIINGFGTAYYGTTRGTYTVVGNAISFMSASESYAFHLDTQSRTYTVQNVNYLSLIAGKSYSATYLFFGQTDSYYATTVFTFNANGTVTISSTSAAYASENGTYQPTFVGSGTYSVNKNQITVKIGGQTFAFSMSDVVKCQYIICQSSTVSTGEVGAFSANQRFETVVTQQ